MTFSRAPGALDRVQQGTPGWRSTAAMTDRRSLAPLSFARARRVLVCAHVGIRQGRQAALILVASPMLTWAWLRADDVEELTP